MEIRSKAEFYRLWRAGCLGNRPRTFLTIEEALKFLKRNPKLPLRLGFREIGTAGGGSFAIIDIEDWHSFKAQVIATAISWQRENRTYCLDAAVPNPSVTLLGEICRTYRGLEGYLGIRTGWTMRSSMAAGLLKSRTPTETLALLAHFMDPSSRDDLDDLLELYPDATIEFACFPNDVGVIPGRNTIFWEVRNY